MKNMKFYDLNFARILIFSYLLSVNPGVPTVVSKILLLSWNMYQLQSGVSIVSDNNM